MFILIYSCMSNRWKEMETLLVLNISNMLLRFIFDLVKRPWKEKRNPIILAL